MIGTYLVFAGASVTWVTAEGVGAGLIRPPGLTAGADAAAPVSEGEGDGAGIIGTDRTVLDPAAAGLAVVPLLLLAQAVSVAASPSAASAAAAVTPLLAPFFTPVLLSLSTIANRPSVD